MYVTYLEDWNDHLHRGEVARLKVTKIAETAGGDNQMWSVNSSRDDGSVYIVQYQASGHGQHVTCGCVAGQFDKPCKHAALVLSRVMGLVYGERFMDAVRQ